MKSQRRILFYPFLVIILLIFATSCSKRAVNLNVNATVTDADGNVYNTKIIGAQTWILENLKTTKYQNGDVIPIVTDSNSWSALTESIKYFV